MILFLVLLSALKDSKCREETRAIKTILRVPRRAHSANEKGAERRSPQISAPKLILMRDGCKFEHRGSGRGSPAPRANGDGLD